MEYSNLESYLWSILPLSGLIPAPTEPKISLEDFPEPVLSVTTLYGIPYNAENYGGNPNLRLITFSAQILEGPISSEGFNLNTYFPKSIYDVKWKILNSSKNAKPKIGFYTLNYSPSINARSSYYFLIPSSRGPALFEGTQGRFSFTNVNNFYVIVEGNHAIELKVRYRKPDSYISPKPKLYKPWYFEYDDERISSVTIADEASNMYFYRPECKYRKRVVEMIKFLKDTAVEIDPIPDNTAVLTKNLLISDLQWRYSGMDFIRSLGSPAHILDMLAGNTVRIQDRDSPGINSSYWAVKLFQNPNYNITTIADIELQMAIPPYNYPNEPNSRLYFREMKLAFGFPRSAGFDFFKYGNGLESFISLDPIIVDTTQTQIKTITGSVPLGLNQPFTGMRFYFNDVAKMTGYETDSVYIDIGGPGFPLLYTVPTIKVINARFNFTLTPK